MFGWWKILEFYESWNKSEEREDMIEYFNIEKVKKYGEKRLMDFFNIDKVKKWVKYV